MIVLVVANSNTQAGWVGKAIVDFSLNVVDSTYGVLFANKAAGGGTVPGLVTERTAGSVEIHEVSGSVTNGPVRVLRLTLQEMEFQILRKRSGL